MKSFRTFIKEKQQLREGGNVQIGQEEADRIDLDDIPRDQIVDILTDGLYQLNKQFKQFAGVPLWTNQLFKKREFLSGSAFHFFNKAIDDERFKSVKKTVGDIDTQVDHSMQDQIGEFLDQLSGSVGPMQFIGYKDSIGQYITLWHIPQFDINIQLDMEMADFYDGEPTEWSQFSHSSAWEDLEKGIKGVFHKYALRALTGRTTEDIILLTGKTQKPKDVETHKIAFSVGKGLRYKMEPVYDEDGKQEKRDGKRVFRELSTKESTYYTDLKSMFLIFFDRQPSRKDLKDMSSFLGVLRLVDDGFDDLQFFAERFANLLWGKGAQPLVRDNDKADYDYKMVAWRALLDQLDISETDRVQRMRKYYYTGG